MEPYIIIITLNNDLQKLCQVSFSGVTLKGNFLMGLEFQNLNHMHVA